MSKNRLVGSGGHYVQVPSSKSNLQLADGGGEWVKYRGPRGGEGWENTVTGERVYQKEKPGTEGGGTDAGGTTTTDGDDEELRAVGLDSNGNWDIGHPRTGEVVASVPPTMNRDDKVRRYDKDNPRYKKIPSARMKMDVEGERYIEFDRSALEEVDRDKVNQMITDATNTSDYNEMNEGFKELNEYLSRCVHPQVDWEIKDIGFMLDGPTLPEVAEFAHELYNAIVNADDAGLLNDVSIIRGLNDPRGQSNIGGFYAPGTGNMFLNPRGAKKSLQEELKADNYSATSSPIGTFWHELAHARHYTNKFTDISAPQKPLREYMEDFGLAGSRLTPGEYSFATKHLSEYAATSHMELIAEAVGASKTGQLDMTDEEMRTLLDIFEKYDGPTEMLR